MSVHGIEPDAGPSARDPTHSSPLSLVTASTSDSSVTREDSNVRRLIPARSLAMCLGFTHEPETDISTFTFWRFGFTVEARAERDADHGRDGVFSAANGGAAIERHGIPGWSNAKKAEAADYGSVKAGGSRRAQRS